MQYMDHDRNKVRCNQISIIRSGDNTEFINRLQTPDLTNRNGSIFSWRDQIQMPMYEVLMEEVASQQQTLATVK